MRVVQVEGYAIWMGEKIRIIEFGVGNLPILLPKGGFGEMGMARWTWRDEIWAM